MYAQLVETGLKNVQSIADMGRGRACLSAAHRRRHQDRGQGLDARRLQENADSPDFQQHAHSEIVGHAARGQLDEAARLPSSARPSCMAKVQDEARPWSLSLQLPRKLWVYRVTSCIDDLHAGKVKYSINLQLPHADVGGYRRDRLAGRRRRHHESDSTVPLLVRTLCASDGSRLQGRVVSCSARATTS